MTAPLRFLSVCSGIEAASVAWHPLGWRAAAVSEIDPFACSVLAHHYPEVPNLGDMTAYRGWDDPAASVLVGGTPCQSFSVAGLRKGLDDPRGNLALVYLGLAERFRFQWLVWENVPGVLSSSGGRDFGAFLGGLGKLGYGFAWRVLDAQFVRTRLFRGAVPQRRRRVFVVGYLGDWRPAAAVLFDSASLRRDPPPRREAGKGLARAAVDGAAGGGGLGPDFDVDGGLIPEVAHTLRTKRADVSEDGTGRGTPIIPEVCNAIAARDHKHPRAEDGVGIIPVAVAIQERAVSENPDAGPDGVGVRVGGAAYTLEARSVPQAVAFDLRGREGGAMPEGPHHTANIRAASGGSSRSYVAVPAAPVAFDAKGSEVQFSAEGVAPPLRAMGHAESHQNGGGQLAVAFAQNQRDEVRIVEAAGALAAEPGMKQQTYLAMGHNGGPPLWQVRRLTPRECERLQGFPDDYTLVPHRRRAAKDGPRYKALGNSMAVNVMGWIGERLELVRSILAESGRPH